MFDLGDEFIMESFRVPWLIWIQILVMFLLIILLYYFSIGALDLADSDHASASAAATASNESHMNNNPHLNTATSSLHNTKVGENQCTKGEMGTSTSTSRGIVRGEDIQGREISSTKDVAHVGLFGISYHPCHFFGLAKQALLKCLGLDFSSETPSSRRRRKER